MSRMKWGKLDFDLNMNYTISIFIHQIINHIKAGVKCTLTGSLCVVFSIMGNTVPIGNNNWMKFEYLNVFLQPLSLAYTWAWGVDGLGMETNCPPLMNVSLFTTLETYIKPCCCQHEHVDTLSPRQPSSHSPTLPLMGLSALIYRMWDLYQTSHVSTKTSFLQINEIFFFMISLQRCGRGKLILSGRCYSTIWYQIYSL